MRAIIVDDEQPAIDTLENKLREAAPDLEIVDRCKDLPEAVRSINANHPDVVFLDIVMPRHSGLELLEFFNADEISFHIIFTTAHSEYAQKAFEMSGIEYLLKPVQKESLQIALEQLPKRSAKLDAANLPILKENLGRDVNKKIVLPVLNGFEVLNSKDIRYLKGDGAWTHFYTAGKAPLVVCKNLGFYTRILDQIPGFMRIHRSYVANLHYVKKVLRDVGTFLVLNDDEQLPITKDRVDAALELISQL